MTEMMNARPHIQVDLNKLSDVKIPQRILQRGIELHFQGRAHQNKLYPWKFMVSGDDYETGTNLYSVDLSTHECGCMYFAVTGTTCKHLVAALLVFIAQTQAESVTV